MSQRLPKWLTETTALPVIAAPMFLVSGPELVLSCCKNGVIGSFPAPNARTIEILEEWMNRLTTELKAYKERNPNKKVAPWAANIVAHRSYKRLQEELALLKKFKPPIVITALGSPIPVIETVHSYGGLVFADVNSVKYAKKAAQAGVDGLVLVSAGAGGHTGSVTGFAFVDAVREFWDGLIVLAGGISTGKSIVAAQALGADLVYMGTKFIAASESMANPEYKEMLVDATHEDLIQTNAFTGVYANMLRPSIERAGIDVNNLSAKKEINFDNPHGDTKAWRDIWSAGHGVGTIGNIQPAGEIIEELKQEYRKAYSDILQPNEWLQAESGEREELKL
ncbi:nitronate monooxygenase family protein [Neobacillus niacini]|uniref:NAD(P)H-dependent flavin oxidoreductase n=1 Tax=Neobacillus niacini TaxID=86668 RepID=UPI0021CB2E02|nr:nitronate monooxygenase [Neobacillus niacini]MCM3763819.1 nitronate monooxygenase [Neobacillus niacini]